LNYKILKERIKKNEGFRNRIYLDQLKFKTIGYGHLVRKSDKFVKGKKYSKNELNIVFEEDFKKAVNSFNKNFKKYSFKKNENEVLIEMIYQLGIGGVLKFKKFISALRKKNVYMAALEMMDSIWYKQTRKRVIILITRLLEVNEKKRQ